ncbi:MAG: flagellar motor stator protein MotA [candidate division Zixibacteria bacterium]|nr:flagellar motor stator protein MotA [candidate division Zixibacteria bacterium]
MLIIVGFIVVFGSVVGGFVLEGGAIMALWQPIELLIIGGAGLGSLLVMAPMHTIKSIISQILGTLSSGYSKKDFTNLMCMLYEIFNIARREGLVGLESHIENPTESEVIKAYPVFLKNHHAVDFMADTMRLIITGSVQPHELEALLDSDLEIHHEEINHAPHILNTVSDSFPGLGIVAAVLGIVITMSVISGPPEIIGHKVGAALVGTFLGILLCYGFVGPLARNMLDRNEADGLYMVCLKQCLLAFCKGFPPSIAVEYGRRCLSNDVRPSFTGLEEACKDTRKT